MNQLITNTLLRIPVFYRLFAHVVGAGRVRNIFVREFVRPCPSNLILDIGCGPADLLAYLPSTVKYYGFDPNEDYIGAARLRYGARADFDVATVHEMCTRQLPCVDLVLAVGVLHHLNDGEAGELFQLAHRLLKPGGRLITFDGCIIPKQSWVTAMMLKADRGAYVRTCEQYLTLAQSYFRKLNVTIRTDLLRIPYTHIIMEATNGRNSI